jgi:hypothetical protein
VPPLPWGPGLRDVADLVPYRTIPIDDPSDSPLMTFTADTRPDDEQVLRLIARSVRWVSSAIGTVDPSLYGRATDVAAIRAAGLIELANPLRVDDLNTADRLLAQAEEGLTILAEINGAVTGESPTGTGSGLPIWAMPPPYVRVGELGPYEPLTNSYWGPYYPAGWTVPPGVGYPPPWDWE